jgi:hypothetical protein
MDYAKGVEVYLEPGEILFVPPMYWHHVDYVTQAASLTIRYGEPSPLATEMLAALPRDWRVQMMILRVLNGVGTTEAEIITSLLHEVRFEDGCSVSLWRRIEETYARVCPEDDLWT